MHILECQAKNGKKLTAIFSPEGGMNLMSYSYGGIEVIDQRTRPLFEKRMAGLGALIGPHFHHRNEDEIPPVDISPLFPFVEELKLKDQKEFLSHGIARYVPWKYIGDRTSIKATLSGDDPYKGVLLKDIEGKSFELTYQADLTEDGLFIKYSMKSDKPSVIGLHYYYALPEEEAIVKAFVEPNFHHPDGWKPIPAFWLTDKQMLNFKVDKEAIIDYGFRPFNDAFETQIELNTFSYKVQINYQASSHENAWQLYHPQSATYVCIEPVSAKNPREAKSLSSELKIQIKILP